LNVKRQNSKLGMKVAAWVLLIALSLVYSIVHGRFPSFPALPEKNLDADITF
jgi:hypothetical protein